MERGDGTGRNTSYYPALYNLADGVATFPLLVQRISQIIDKFGKMRDNASPELLQIRRVSWLASRKYLTYVIWYLACCTGRRTC